MRLPLCPLLAALCLLASGGQPASALGAGTHVKRGVASARYLASDPSKLARLGASWAYDWSATAPRRLGGLTWVPMVWGSGSVTPSTIARLRVTGRAGRARYLLGFNEPDFRSQSNLSPQRAATLWPQLEGTGLVLGSPAPAVPTDGWLARFMALAGQRHLRVDFIALHYYQDFTNPRALSALRRQLVSIHSKYRRPIWITEIGAIDLRSWHEPMLRTPTHSLAAAYMRNLFALLDALPFVQRYAWFTDDCWNHVACRFGSLFDSGGRLTLAGRTFATAP
jgi:Glycosyl hydrolase catalytic core